MKLKNLFITGTNTGVGKTYITGCIGYTLTQIKRKVITQKWVQTGSHEPEDILSHLSLMNMNKKSITPYLNAVCPYIFSLPASPHLAALQENTIIQKSRLSLCYHSLAKTFDHVIVEGAGGLLVPISAQETLADVVMDLDIPTILVVNNTLGCINHTLLTINEIKSRSIPLLGLIFNQIDPDENPNILEDNPKIINAISEFPY